MTRTFCRTWLALLFLALVASPAIADDYLAYSQAGIPAGADIFTWCDTPPCDVGENFLCATPEGGTSMRMNTNLWGGWGVFLLGDLADLSGFADGELRFWVRSSYDLKTEIQCRPQGSNVTYTTFLSQHGWDGTSNWQQISIPIADFFAPNPVDLDCLATMYSPFMATIENLPFFNSFTIDFAHWTKPNTHAGASTVEVQGRQLLVNGEPFVVNAMAYSPIGVGEGWRDSWRDRPDRYLVDFPQIADTGANALRLYAPILTTAMLDAAWAEGLYVIPTYGVDSIQLECEQGKAFMQARFVEMVEKWKDHPAILFWLVGNEVNTNLGSADLCIDWYPQLDAMAAAAHAAEGASFHPVGTAVAEMADICVAGCSDDTALPNVDLWGTQIYRGCSFSGAFNEYRNKVDCDRPLVVTEFGADSWDSILDAENQTMQADCLGQLLDEADQELAVRTASGSLSGQVIFSWTDEWWKAECDPGTSWFTQDTCTSWTQGGYPDPSINEEWWGIASLDDLDPGARGLRDSATRVSESWFLGSICDLQVPSHNASTGETSLSFGPGAGSTDHTLYYGPLSAVSSYGFSGKVSGLGATGSSSVSLPEGSLFWVVVPRNNGEEGTYGRDSSCSERPTSPDASIPQAGNRTWQCSWCP